MQGRPIIASLHRRARLGASVVLAVLGCGPLSPANAAEPGRTDLDGVCSWGRLADGHGRLVRCLTREEAARLRETSPSPAASAPPSAPKAATSGEPASGVTLGTPPAEPPKPKDGASAPSSEEPHEAAPPTEGTVPPAPAPSPESLFEVEVGSVTADSGSLPDAQKSFSKARERFAACVAKNGGLTADRGSVELRFLVQGLGRAEGVSVKKHRGMSEAAAKCIGNVVDRRYVGYPDEPAVGATVVVTLSKKKR